MRVIWINGPSRFIGGCEGYIHNTVKLLKPYGISSTLLYDPLQSSQSQFLQVFDAAFPLVDLIRQLQEIPHDLIYLHQLESLADVKKLNNSAAPVVKFLHDHQLFCLRGDKLLRCSNCACEKRAGYGCYPFGMILKRKPNWLGFGISTLSSLHARQNAHYELDAFFTASQFMNQTAICCGFPKEKVHTTPLYPFTSTTLSEKAAREPFHLLFVGQLIRSKGVDTLLQAMKLLPPRYHLTIAGDGRLAHKYRQQSEELNLSGRVEFLGSLPQHELPLFYQRASCLVMPSRWPEPFGLVGLEAMHFGTPVVASRVGGIIDWLEEGKNGLTVPPNTPLAIAEAVQCICENPHLASKLEQYAEKSVNRRFGAELHASILKEKFEELIRKKAVDLRGPRYTFEESPQVEKQIDAIIAAVKLALQKILSPEQYRCVLLMGGYGKGEGGVEVRNGIEFPHNNIDLLIVSRKMGKVARHRCKGAIDAALLEISDQYQIGFDTSLVPEEKLKNVSPTLLYYELYNGHQVLLGETKFIPSLAIGDLKSVPLAEFQALLANRGSLLIVNDWLLKLPRHSNFQKLIIKHMMKAIIGFGDAWLYFLGGYHWSYGERLLRIRVHVAFPETFRQLYAEAAAFRFRPDYAAYVDRDLTLLSQQVHEELASAYLSIQRLDWHNPLLSPDECVEVSLRGVWQRRYRTMREWLKSWSGLISPTFHPVGNSLSSKIAFLRLPQRRRMHMIFPVVAFSYGDAHLKEQVARFLGAIDASPEELTKGYLALWSRYGDINFTRSQGEWGVLQQTGNVGQKASQKRNGF